MGGGFNSPMPLKVDVNGDYKMDLVIYDNNDNSFITFLNSTIQTAHKYVFHPEYMDTLRGFLPRGF